MISQVLVYECDYCGHTMSKRQQCNLHALSPLFYEILPNGWKFIGQQIACPNHTVIVKTVQDKTET